MARAAVQQPRTGLQKENFSAGGQRRIQIGGVKRYPVSRAIEYIIGTASGQSIDPDRMLIGFRRLVIF